MTQGFYLGLVLLHFLLGNPVSSVPSPSGAAPHSSAEEQAYLEKLGMLSKYIEPLRRSVNSLEKNKDEGILQYELHLHSSFLVTLFVVGFL